MYFPYQKINLKFNLMLSRLKIIVVILVLGAGSIKIVEAQTDFNDVAPIFYQYCTSCHHEGQVAYFPLLTYDQVVPYTQFIQTDLITDHMPPWFPDTAYIAGGNRSPRFIHENVITEEAKNQILQWIIDGTLEGDPAQAITLPKYEEKFKLNGNATLTLKIPDFRSNATTENERPDNCFSLATGLSTDRWLQAFEIVPGNLSTVHNVTVTLDTTGSKQSDTSGYCTNGIDEIYIGSWGPGGPPTVFPNNPSLKAGFKIPAGSNIILRINYASGSVNQLDSTKIRLFFYPENETSIREIHSDAFLQYWGKQGLGGADILANSVASFTVTPSSDQTYPHALPPNADISLLSIAPLSRDICTIIHDYAFMGTDTIPLIHFKLWDYEWEGNYFFPALEKIPAGYTLKSNRYFDNTGNNIHQPYSPIRDVFFGSTSTEEIVYDSFLWLDYQAGDELIDVKSIIANDTLMDEIVGVNYLLNPSPLNCLVYPNPTTDKLTIYLSNWSSYNGGIISLTGQTILSIDGFNQSTSIDTQKIPAGVYVLEIIDINSKARVTKKIVIAD